MERQCKNPGLAVGFIRLSNEMWIQTKSLCGAWPKEFPSPLRDTCRIDLLEKELDCEVITMGGSYNGQHERHVPHYFTARSIRSKNSDLVKHLDKRQIRFIFVDFIRMPTAYLDYLTVPILKTGPESVLSQLAERDLLASDVKIYIPVLEGRSLPPAELKFRRRRSKVSFTLVGVLTNENPLVQATAKMEDENMGSESLEASLKLLRGFMCYTLK